MESGIKRTQRDYTLAFKLSPKRAYHKTTDSHRRLRCHPNLLKPGEGRRIQPSGREQVWLADITYWPTHDRFVDLSLITDAYSRKIVGHHVHDSRHTGQVSQTLKKALSSRQTQQASLQLKTPDEVHRASVAGLNQPSILQL